MSLKHLFPSRKSGGRTIESRDLMDEYLAKDLSRRHLLQGALASAAIVGCGSDPAPGGTPRPDAAAPDASHATTSVPVCARTVTSDAVRAARLRVTHGSAVAASAAARCASASRCCPRSAAPSA